MLVESKEGAILRSYIPMGDFRSLFNWFRIGQDTMPVCADIRVCHLHPGLKTYISLSF